MAKPAIVYIGLGSNLEQPWQQLATALIELDQMTGSYLLAHSSFYQSSPMKDSPMSLKAPETQESSEPQADYINAVAKIATYFSPLELLIQLQTIENAHQRVRLERWGARTLDLDILLYDHTIMETETLTIPHIGIKQRDFVLVPLAEISPKLILPTDEKVQDLLANCQQHNLKKLD